MAVTVDSYSSNSGGGAMQARHERDHRLAIALLTKSRCLLPPRVPATTSTETPPPRDRVRARDVIEQALSSGSARESRPPPAPSSLAAMQPVVATAVARKKRQAAALSTFAALQAGGKRPRLSSMDNRRAGSSGGDSAVRRECALRGIARRGVSGRPRSLQFALQGLSSSDTRYLLQLLADLPHDIAQLNATTTTASSTAITSLSPKTSLRRRDESTPTLRVFGWRNRFLQPCVAAVTAADSESPDDRAASCDSALVVWKAVKTFEATDMRPLAHKVWDSARALSQTPVTSHVSAFEVLYAVSASVRVVRCVDTLYGRHEHETLWLECFLDRDDHICIGRRQLTHFRDYRLQRRSEAAAVGCASNNDASDDPSPSLDEAECECEGFLFRPHLTRLGGGSSSSSSDSDGDTFMLGCTLQRVSSLAGRGLAPHALVRNLVDDLPRATLQWEEAVVHDLLPQITY